MHRLSERSFGTFETKTRGRFWRGLAALAALTCFSACGDDDVIFPSGGDCDMFPDRCAGAFCGNGKVEGDELCDKTDLNGETCKTLGDGLYTSGSLRCSSKCTFDVSMCIGNTTSEICGDGKDNDGDGKADCDDADCANDSTCTNSSMGGQPNGAGGHTSAAGDAGAPQGMAGAGEAGAGTAGAGGEGGQPAADNSKLIYLTGTPKKANFGGITAADILCNATPPRLGIYKALLVDGTQRRACTTADCSGGASEHVDWVLSPDTTYSRPDKTIIGTTNSAGIFAFPLKASIEGVGYSYWTGLNADWTTSDDDCGDWAQTAGYFATEGLGDATDSDAIYGVSESCATLAGAFFACVEQ